MHHVPEFRVLRVCLRGSRAHDFPVRSPSRELSRSYKSGSPRFQRWNRVIHPVCFVEIITADVCWRIFETVVLFVILRWRREMLFECLAFSRLIENGMEDFCSELGWISRFFQTEVLNVFVSSDGFSKIDLLITCCSKAVDFYRTWYSTMRTVSKYNRVNFSEWKLEILGNRRRIIKWSLIHEFVLVRKCLVLFLAKLQMGTFV